MAKKSEIEVNEKTFNAVAKQFIKYDGKYLEAGEKFQVKESDVKELSGYAEIEIPEEETQQGENGGE